MAFVGVSRIDLFMNHKRNAALHLKYSEMILYRNQEIIICKHMNAPYDSHRARLLIYRIEAERLILGLIRTGTHSDLF